MLFDQDTEATEVELPDCLCKTADGLAVPRGGFVVVIDESMRDRWFFEWPGVVVKKRGTRATVEFLGLGDPEKRTKRLQGHRLKLIDNLDLLGRLHRVTKRMLLPGRKVRKRRAS